MDVLILRLFPKMKSKGVDSVEGIFAMLLCFAAYFLVSAGYKATPIFFSAFLEEFKVTRQEASWPSAVFNFVMNFSGLFLAPLAEKFTIRPVVFVCTLLGSIGYIINYFIRDLTVLAITFGGGAGLTFGMMMLTVSVLMTQYFNEYRTVAVGAVFAGGAAGGFIFPSILSFLYDTYGYSILMLVNGFILILCLPLCYFMREPEWLNVQETASQKTDKPAGKPSILKQLSALIEPSFYVILIPTLAYYWASAACVTTMVDFTKHQGYTKEDGKHLTEVFGVSEMIGQLFLPIICNRGYISNEWMAFIINFLSGLMLIVWTFCPNYASIMALLAIIGPAFGLASIFYRVFVGDYLGMQRMKMVFGLLVAFKGIMLLGNPSFVGYFVDHHDNYEGMFITCGVLLTALSFLWMGMAIKKYREDRLEIQNEEDIIEYNNETGHVNANFNEDTLSSAPVIPRSSNEARN